jgi:hypothetical protein
LVEAAFALGQTAERIIVMHKSFAVGADLQIDLDAVTAVDRGAQRARGILDEATRCVMQPAMGDRPCGQPVERRPH